MADNKVNRYPVNGVGTGLQVKLSLCSHTHTHTHTHTESIPPINPKICRAHGAWASGPRVRQGRLLPLVYSQVIPRLGSREFAQWDLCGVDTRSNPESTDLWVASQHSPFCNRDTCSHTKSQSRVHLFATPRTGPRQAPPWDSPGKNTGVGYHVLLQGIFLT